MDKLISCQAAIEAIRKFASKFQGFMKMELYIDDAVEAIEGVPPAQPETSRIENVLHGKSAEEQYDFLMWLTQNYGRQFIDTRIALIEWLRGETDG